MAFAGRSTAYYRYEPTTPVIKLIKDTVFFSFAKQSTLLWLINCFLILVYFAAAYYWFIQRPLKKTKVAILFIFVIVIWLLEANLAIVSEYGDWRIYFSPIYPFRTAYGCQTWKEIYPFVYKLKIWC